MHYCHWFRLALLTQENQTKTKQSAGSLSTRKLAGIRLSQIAKMADRLFADRVTLPVTAAIYRNCIIYI